MLLLIIATAVATLVVFIRTLTGTGSTGGEGASVPSEPAGGAVVTACTGKASIVPAGEWRTVDLLSGRELAAGDVVGAEQGTRITVSFADGDEMRIFNKASFRFEGRDSVNEVRLLAGTLFADAHAGGRDLSVTTPHAGLLLSTGRCLVRADKGRTVLGVGNGSATVTRAADRASMVVKAGHNAIIEEGRDFRPGDGCFCEALGRAVAPELEALNEGKGVGPPSKPVRTPRFRGRRLSTRRQVGETPGIRGAARPGAAP